MVQIRIPPLFPDKIVLSSSFHNMTDDRGLPSHSSRDRRRVNERVGPSSPHPTQTFGLPSAVREPPFVRSPGFFLPPPAQKARRVFKPFSFLFFSLNIRENAFRGDLLFLNELHGVPLHLSRMQTTPLVIFLHFFVLPSSLRFRVSAFPLPSVFLLSWSLRLNQLCPATRHLS